MVETFPVAVNSIRILKIEIVNLLTHHYWSGADYYKNKMDLLYALEYACANNDVDPTFQNTEHRTDDPILALIHALTILETTCDLRIVAYNIYTAANTLR